MIHRSLVGILMALVVAVSARADGETIAARYVLLAYDPVNDLTTSLARVIVEPAGADCPAIEIRRSEDDEVEIVAMTVRPNPDRDVYPVTVCEAVVPPGAAANVGGLGFPVFDPDPKRLAVIGDSGCLGGEAQDCDKAWPFPGIARDAAASGPDLVIHVGDYNYRGTPKKTIDGESTYDSCLPKPGAPWVTQTADDTWKTWAEDVFVPAAPLMEAAPWVVTRGNHELCSRAGRGWFYFLDPHSTLLDPYNAPPTCNAPVVQTDPYPLDLGDLRLVVFDSANACDEAGYENQAAIAYQTRVFAPLLDQTAALAGAGAEPVWLLTHHPIWGTAHYTGEAERIVLNAVLQQALAQSSQGVLSDSVELVVSGHMHEFQSIAFEGDRPPQLVVGNAGVRLDDNLIPSEFAYEIDGLSASGLAISAHNGAANHGFLELELADEGRMKGHLHAFDPDGTRTGRVIATCGLPLDDEGLCQMVP